MIPTTYDELHDNYGLLLRGVIRKYARTQDPDEVYQHLWLVLLRRDWLTRVRARVASETSSPEGARTLFLRLLYTFAVNEIRSNYRSFARHASALCEPITEAQSWAISEHPEPALNRTLGVRSLASAVLAAVADDLELSSVVSAVLSAHTETKADVGRQTGMSRVQARRCLLRIRTRVSHLHPAYVHA